MTQLVEYLSSMQEALGLILAPQELAMVACTCNPDTWAVEAGAQGHPELPNKFKANLGYMKSCFNNIKPRKETES